MQMPLRYEIKNVVGMRKGVHIVTQSFCNSVKPLEEKASHDNLQVSADLTRERVTERFENSPRKLLNRNLQPTGRCLELCGNIPRDLSVSWV